jgi:hypothetical protein
MRRVLALAALVPAAVAVAGQATVIGARAERMGGHWRFEVTVRHADAGWDHFADAWEILAPDGTRLAVRELMHPHDDEQPFTKTLSAVHVPAGVDRVLIRAHDTAHGWGGAFVLELPR